MTAETGTGIGNQASARGGRTQPLGVPCYADQQGEEDGGDQRQRREENCVPQLR